MTTILPEGLKQQSAFDMATRSIIDNNSLNSTLSQLNENVSLASVCPEGLVGIGVPLATHAFIQRLVADT